LLDLQAVLDKLAQVDPQQARLVELRIFGGMSGVPMSGLNDFDLGQNLLDHFAMQYKAVLLVTALQWAVVEALLLLTLIVALKRLIKSTVAQPCWWCCCSRHSPLSGGALSHRWIG